MKDSFYINIESMHLPDKGHTENVSFYVWKVVRLLLTKLLKGGITAKFSILSQLVQEIVNELLALSHAPFLNEKGRIHNAKDNLWNKFGNNNLCEYDRKKILC